ncbi:MAG: TolC family protein [Candidatus Omnitrophica bacterium]|nr:TolC family protein [Candidatus Omnitrophota bacterium]
MKKILLLCVIVLSVIGVVYAQSISDASLSLKECYTLALKRSEVVGIYKEYIKETEGVMLQALSTALPKVAFAYSDKWQDVHGNNSIGNGTPEAKFTFTQPLFTGFKEFAAIGASKHVGKQREADLARARQLLFTDVSDAFYLYLSYQQSEETLGAIHEALLNRVAELKKRVDIGKSRVSESVTAEARLSINEAAIESVRAEKEVAGQLIEFLIGQPVKSLLAEDLPPEARSLDSLSGKLDARPDVVSAREAVESYKSNIVSARSSFFPTVALTGNAYTKRGDTNEGNDWDATVSVNVPLFNGLSDVGQVAQARAQKNEADLRLSQIKRTALLEIKNNYTKWQSAGRRVTALNKADQASEKNYKYQVEDFKSSLVNNLDVLQALEDWQNVRLNLVAARADFYRNYWAMKVAVGETGL